MNIFFIRILQNLAEIMFVIENTKYKAHKVDN